MGKRDDGYELSGQLEIDEVFLNALIIRTIEHHRKMKLKSLPPESPSKLNEAGGAKNRRKCW